MQPGISCVRAMHCAHAINLFTSLLKMVSVSKTKYNKYEIEPIICLLLLSHSTELFINPAHKASSIEKETFFLPFSWNYDPI
jgi:hypothetical protein